MTKPAVLETGAEIKVPLFIDIGDKITIDTRDGRVPVPLQGVSSAIYGPARGGAGVSMSAPSGAYKRFAERNLGRRADSFRPRQ